MVKPDPELSSSGSSPKKSLSDLKSKKNKRDKKKNVVSIKDMNSQTHLRATIQILPMTVIADASDSKIRVIGKRNR